MMKKIYFPIAEEYYGELLKAIRMTWDHIVQLYDDGHYDPTANQSRSVYLLRNSRRFMDQLYQIRENLRTRAFPSERERQGAYLGQMLYDWEDSPLTDQLLYVFTDYLRQDRIELKAIPAVEEDIDAIRRQFEAWKEVFRAEETLRREAELKQRAEQSAMNDWRMMPHLPDPRSMILQREDSIERRKKNDADGPLAAARAAQGSNFFKALSSACFIEGYTDYLVNRPVNEVVSHLRRGCEHAAQAIEYGFTAHAWQINDYLHEAIAVNHAKLAETVIRLRQSDWDTNRIRPVNWLITRIRIVMDLYQKKESDLQVLLENERKGLFDEKLPSELDPDLPEMRNFYELLKALVERNESAFNQALAARMPIREAHFQRGGTVAPIALLDVHGLALCRLARKRSIKPQANHVYLPLEILDLES